MSESWSLTPETSPDFPITSVVGVYIFWGTTDYICVFCWLACTVILVFIVAKKNQVSQANKLKREERLTEIDSLLQNNKELQEQIMQKLDEARALSATSEVHWLICKITY